MPAILSAPTCYKNFVFHWFPCNVISNSAFAVWSVTTYLSCGLILSSWVLYSTVVKFMLFCKILLQYKIILVTLSCSLKFYPIADYSINFPKEQEGRFRPLKSNMSLLIWLVLAFSFIIFHHLIVLAILKETFWHASLILNMFSKYLSLQEARHILVRGSVQPGSVASARNHRRVSGSFFPSLFTDLQIKTQAWLKHVV